IGIGGPNRFLSAAARGEAEPTATERANAAAQRALRAPAEARDAELGLGADGPVLRALADAPTREATSVDGAAVFIAIAGADGKVTSLSFVSGTGNETAWRATAKRALGELEGKRLRMPVGARGVSLELAVSSAWKLPSGNDPGLAVDAFGGIPLKKGEGKKSPRISLLDPLPRIVNVPLTPDGKTTIPVPVLQLRVFETTADPTDVGAKPRRVVHARLVRTHVL
ncbi:MAG: hypothetical protein KC560_14860, partial [Myxococcales bacterium]|nr:hypothetical protein [Myxococcales bacterium]